MIDEIIAPIVYGLCSLGFLGSFILTMRLMLDRNSRMVDLDDSDGIVVNEHPRVIEYLYANRLPSWIRGKYNQSKRDKIKAFYEDDKPTYRTDGRGNVAVRVKNEERFRAWLKEQGLL